jgi:hypothetical protein
MSSRTSIMKSLKAPWIVGWHLLDHRFEIAFQLGYVVVLLDQRCNPLGYPIWALGWRGMALTNECFSLTFLLTGRVEENLRKDADRKFTNCWWISLSLHYDTLGQLMQRAICLYPDATSCLIISVNHDNVLVLIYSSNGRDKIVSSAIPLYRLGMR